jgi:hypothetical protein
VLEQRSSISLQVVIVKGPFLAGSKEHSGSNMTKSAGQEESTCRSAVFNRSSIFMQEKYQDVSIKFRQVIKINDSV